MARALLGSSITPTARPTVTTTELTAARAPSGFVALAATETAANGTHPAGWVEFETGGTGIGTPVAVNSRGVATATATSLGWDGTLTAAFMPASAGYLASAATDAAAVPGNGSIVLPGKPGLAAGGVLASAADGSGLGTDTLGATLTLDIPASARSGAYTATLTLTYLDTGPKAIGSVA